MLKTYVISLSYPEKLMASLPELGLDPVWSPGVDGKKLTREEIAAHTSPIMTDLITPSGMGCALAHIRTWEKIVENDDPYALIVEDDVVFVPDFEEKFKEIFPNTPADYDVLYLGCFACNSRFSPSAILLSMAGAVRLDAQDIQINKYIAKPAAVNATHAYIVSNKGARVLLREIKNNIKFQIDITIQHLYNANRIVQYVTTPRLAYQTSTNTIMSVNTTNSHPYLLHRLLSNVYIDTLARADYNSRSVLFKVGKFPVTGASAFIIFLGLAAAIARIDILYLIVGFAIVSIPDIVYKSDLYSIMLHFALFIGPSLLLGSSLKASRRK